MKIVLVNHQDPDNINSFSGISYFMSRAIKKTFEEVLTYNDFESYLTTNRVLDGHFGKTLKPIGKKLNDFLKVNDVRADFVICQGGNSSIPFYNYNIPIVFWHDSTWCSFLKGHESQKKFNEFKARYKELYLWDKMALDRCALLVFSSDYVAEACLKYYKLPADKVKVVPFGANLFSPPSANALNELLQRRMENEVLNFTFIGKDWKRKGLTAAYHLVKKLNSTGIKAKLNVIGCYPDVSYLVNSPDVYIVGFIDKFNEKGRGIFENILNDTHFLLHPAIAEPFGIVLCEANAYGVPVLGTKVDGLKTTIRQGENGFLFDRNRFIDEAYNLVAGMAKRWDTSYPALFSSSVKEYNKRLNWETNAMAVKNILAGLR
jgi:glycosyltransferase involved in cell wall biosynthesis